MTEAYLHGYEPRESERLRDQAETLVEFLLSGTTYLAGSQVGAMTVIEGDHSLT